MNWDIWSGIESVLLEFELTPILAVVPDNQDPMLKVGPPCDKFWEKVREWQARRWTIGLHGYQHAYASDDGGIVGIAPHSEFAGLPEPEQKAKLQKAVEIFQREGVTPHVWVAPAHSFDQTTILALKDLGINVISDGFALAPHEDSDGLLWVPQQLWRFRWRPFGVWTVCYHHNRWTQKDVAAFRAEVKAYREAISSLPSILHGYSSRQRRLLDDVYAFAHRSALLLKRQIQPVS
jgi:predicted deacetylase